MELYGLDCVDLVVSYTIQFIFRRQKVQILHKDHPHPILPPAASNRYEPTERYAEKKNLCDEKEVILKINTH